ncbi:Bug family tripartite tricarboxylate transporter substrate binding protein [Bordetella genomosp. 13]|uniref:Bug family tripartite tricarboxylate transporter substrate binding protein n=1 Tax=Bordetella genomosp. 13 TaxID=463040 RepID=UPI0011AACB5D|nr:tripartite tricarboxylate transporter substrate binding protein [Bordetella genomosp. 13]
MGVCRIRRSIIQRAALAVAIATASPFAVAQGFPSHAINLVVPYAPGGSSDVVARLMAQKLSEQFGQSVVVENKPGAGATIGTAYVAQPGHGGYVALLADNAQTTAPAMYTKLSYDPVKDFSVAGFVGQASALLFASKNSGLASVQDVLDKSRAKPRSLTIGTGNGSPSHLISELFQIKSGAQLQVVPYKGASAALNDLLAGHIDMVFTNPASAAQYLEGGRLTVLGQTGDKRDPRFANVPNFKDSGIKNLDVAYWFAVLLPADTPADIKARWRKEVDVALNSPEVKAKLDSLGINQTGMTPAAAESLIKDEAVLWKQVVKEAGIKAE